MLDAIRNKISTFWGGFFLAFVAGIVSWLIDLFFLGGIWMGFAVLPGLILAALFQFWIRSECREFRRNARIAREEGKTIDETHSDICSSCNNWINCD